MNEERHSERPVERQGEREAERDSQLSAMFDAELPAAECELLARRLTRDDALRSQWSRYSLIGAALRAERGVRLDDRVARRVQASLSQEPTYGEAAEGAARPAALSAAPAANAASTGRWMRFALPAAGAAGIAASVAAVLILWLRGAADSGESMIAANTDPAPQAVTVAPALANTTVAVAPAGRVSPGTGEPERYSTPPVPSSPTSIAPPARLANYVVAHSEYSGPLSRRMALLSLVGGEAQAEAAAPANQKAEPAADAAGTPDAP